MKMTVMKMAVYSRVYQIVNKVTNYYIFLNTSVE